MSRHGGFTVVETLVTLVVGVALLLAINTLFVVVIRSTSTTRNRTEASNEAYAYLRKYTYAGAPSTWFNCTGQSDIQQNARAKGQVVDSGSLSTAQSTLPQPVAYKVLAFAPSGCSGSLTGTPLLIRATITYGPDSLTSSQATYLARACTGSCQSNPLLAGLVAWWPFDGDATDHSGNGHNATVYSATLTTGQGGYANTAYSFNGTSSYISPNAPLLNGLSAYSIGGWMYYTAGQTTNAGFAGQNDSVENYFVNGTDSTFYQGGATTTCPYLVTGNWHFIYITWDGTTTRQYADGAQCDSSNNTRTDSTYSFNIGGGGIRDPSGNYFNGKIDDVRIYSRALPLAQIQNLYSSGAQ